MGLIGSLRGFIRGKEIHQIDGRKVIITNKSRANGEIIDLIKAVILDFCKKHKSAFYFPELIFSIEDIEGPVKALGLGAPAYVELNEILPV